VIENNGEETGAAGIRVRGNVNGLVFRNNVIRDTRTQDVRRQTVGILIEQDAGSVELDGNQIDAAKEVEDLRKAPIGRGR